MAEPRWWISEHPDVHRPGTCAALRHLVDHVLFELDDVDDDGPEITVLPIGTPNGTPTTTTSPEPLRGNGFGTAIARITPPL